MSKFNAGDRVRVTKTPDDDYHFFKVGDTGTVTQIPGDFNYHKYRVQFDESARWREGHWWIEDGCEIELLEDEKPVIEVGQKWRCLAGFTESDSVQTGSVVTVAQVDADKVCTTPGAYDETGWSTPEDFLKRFELVEEDEEVAVDESNPISPNVYQFPNCEVRDISAHLTSFGGQAVQYIARATRLDGVVKGLPVQDLYKAIELLKWEAERLEALQN